MSTEADSESGHRALSSPSWKRYPFWLMLVVFSIIYFARTLLRAADKPFWYDELCTLYITRLPTFAASWAAEMHGADYNPPFFYVIHRAAYALFGGGQLALRIPEIVSFWVFCVCLFRFVTKRAGLAAGWIAMALPLMTGAYYYATEARPHGLILGFLGLGMVCWQELQEKPRSWGWGLGFVIAMELAYFIHCYAVLLAIPFAVVELWRIWRTRQIRWGVWLSIAIPPAIAAVSFIPLLRTYHNVLAAAGFGHQFAPKLSDIYDFFVFVFTPCWFILILVFALYVVKKRRATVPIAVPDRLAREQDFALMFGLLALPVYGIVLGFVMHAPIFLRYLLGGTAGCVLLLAYGSVSKRLRNAATVIALLVGLYISAMSAEALRLRHKGLAESMTEPNGSEWVFSRNLSNPMELYAPMLAGLHKDEPLVVHDMLNFLYMYHYAPQLRPQLYSVSLTDTKLEFLLNRAVRIWCHVDFNREEDLPQFVAGHRDFQMYGARSDYPLLDELARKYHATFSDFKLCEYAHYLVRVHIPAR